MNPGQEGGVCWECGQPLTSHEDRERGAHQECVNAHMDYVERWGSDPTELEDEDA